jgi:hypothetical protein
MAQKPIYEFTLNYRKNGVWMDVILKATEDRAALKEAEQIAGKYGANNLYSINHRFVGYK